MSNAWSVPFRLLNETLITDQSFLCPDVQNANLCWRPPELDVVKVNFDVAFCDSSHTLSTGVVIRDWRGTFIHASREGSHADLALVVECFATRLALTRAH